MPKPLLNLGDVRLVIERIGGRGRTERMDAKALRIDADSLRMKLHHLVINTGSRKRPLQTPKGILHGPKKRSVLVL